MLKTLIKKIVGTSNDRKLKKYERLVKEINAEEKRLEDLSDEELRAEFTAQRERGVKDDTTKVSVFSIVREASKRTLGLRHFDTQMMGGLALIDNCIAEMGTGEGKTLVSTLSCSYNVAVGNSVHVVTVNEYLAKRDSESMSPVFNLLGMTVGCNESEFTSEQKKEQYSCDVVYGTNSDFGFDYLRDNLVKRNDDKVQGALDYCLIDEIDSILIDEARTPLVISGSIEQTGEMYRDIKNVVSIISEEDVDINEKESQVQLNDSGNDKVEEELRVVGLLSETGSLYSQEGLSLMHYINATLRARFIMVRDIDYLVKDGEVCIIDEFTGRTMHGRRWSNGVHQALEQKENLEVQPENETVASITYQNYFRMYKNLSGMTGTADTEAPEFMDIYGLEVVCIPKNVPSMRQDHNDRMYSTMEYKINAIIDDIRDTNQRKQPVLVGTPNVEVSENISKILKKHKVKHEVLNAKNHSREAEIIERAGSLGAVTIATNMAGRGTDIKLGGPENKEERQEVIKSGGLRVIGVERQDNRRLDNQLIGRSGRQGDIGSSCFYVSPDDNLLRIFGGDKIKSVMDMLDAGDEVIEHKFLNKGVTNAQKKIEGANYDARKNLIKYDDVANTQREIVYGLRNNILSLEGDDLDNYIFEISKQTIKGIVGGIKTYEHYPEEEEEKLIVEKVSEELGYSTEYSNQYEDNLVDIFKGMIDTLNNSAPEQAQEYKIEILLSTLDREWVSHIRRSEELKSSVNLRGYAQKDPIKEFNTESFESFSYMLDEFRNNCIKTMVKSIGKEISRATEVSNGGWLVSDRALGSIQ